MDLNYDKIENIVLGDVYQYDYPDFCDAFIESADLDGIEMTEEQLNILNEDEDFVNSVIVDYLF